MNSLASLVAVLAGDDDLVDVLVVEVADRALDQRAFLVDQLRRGRFQGQVTHGLPQPQQVFEIALDLGLGAARARGAQDHAHAFRHFQFLRDLLELAAVLGVGDLAADAAAARRIRHQHRIAAGERQIGGERRTLGAALLLDDLHQHHLPALDHFLNFVLAAQPRHALGHFLHGIGAADQFDRFLLTLGAVTVDLGDVVGRSSMRRRFRRSHRPRLARLIRRARRVVVPSMPAARHRRSAPALRRCSIRVARARSASSDGRAGASFVGDDGCSRDASPAAISSAELVSGAAVAVVAGLRRHLLGLPPPWPDLVRRLRSARF